MNVDTERFSTVPLFEGLEPMQVAGFLRIAEDVVASAGDVIVKEGNAGDGFYVIGKGAYDVIKGDSPDNALARLEELSFFGEMSLVSNLPRTASVICVEEGRLKKFPLAGFQELFDSADPVAYRVIFNMSRILAERLARLEERFLAEVWKASSK